MNRKLCVTGISAAVLTFALGTVITAAASSTIQNSITRLKSVYIGMLLGATETHYGLSGFDSPAQSQEVDNGTINSSNFGYRGILGYQFNNYIAAEASYTRYGTTTGDHLAYSNGGSANAAGTIREYSAELMGKFMYPLAQEVNIFARAGAAYIHSRAKNDSGLSKTRKAISPAYGLGVDFNITKQFVIDISYNQVHGNSKIQPADLFGFGFYYHFS